MIDRYNLDWRAGLIFAACVLLGALFIALCAGATHAQTCTTSGQVPVWSTSTKWTCATPTTPPLPAGSSLNMTVANAGTTGTTVNRLAKLTGAPSTAIITATSDTENAIGVCTSGCGTTGSATIAIMGQVTCDFDNATTAGNYVTISAITAGKCHDAGSSFPTGGATYGRVLSTNGASGSFIMELMTPDVAFQNAGNGKSKPGPPLNSVQFNNPLNTFRGDSTFTFDVNTGTVSATNFSGNSVVGLARGDTGSAASTGTIYFQNGNRWKASQNGSTAMEMLPSYSKLGLGVQFDKSNTTLSDVTGLTVALSGGVYYSLHATLFITADTVGGIKLTIRMSSGGFSFVSYQTNAIANSTNVFAITSYRTAGGGAGVGTAGDTSYTVTLDGVIATSGSGNFEIQFAQNAASGTSSILNGSYVLMQHLP